MSRIVLCFVAVLVAVAAGPQAYAQTEFQSPAIYPLPQEAHSIAVGDLNGDGRDDVAATTWSTGLYVFYQQPDGALGSAVQFFSPYLPLGLSIADLNGDSRLDLLVGGADGVILAYYQTAGGALGAPLQLWGYNMVNSIVVDDLNGDGLADVADTFANSSATLLLSYQTSSHTFGMPAMIGLSGYNAKSLCTLDFNSDGSRDIALLTGDQVCVLYGPAFTDVQYIPAQWSYALTAGDVTGDGLDDLVFAVATNQPQAAVGVIEQNPDGSYQTPVLHAAYDFPQSLALADANEDGRTDVVAVHGGYEAVTAFLQGEDGTLGDWVSYPAPYSNNYEPQALGVGDLNSDGHLDLAIADPWNGVVVFLHASTEPPADQTAPTCTASISGTLGSSDWYVSPVVVTIAAEDNAGGSGVGEVDVTLDGASWAPYEQPLVFSTDGEFQVGFRARDLAGNQSGVQWLDVKLDRTAPTLGIVPSTRTIWPPNGEVFNVPVTVTGADLTSGLTALHLSVDDEYGLVEPEMDVTPGMTITVPLVASRNEGDSDGRVYTLTLTGADAAGNTAVATTTVTVPRSNPGKPDKPKPNKPKK